MLGPVLVCDGVIPGGQQCLFRLEMGFYFVDETVDGEFHMRLASAGVNGIQQRVTGSYQVLVLFIDSCVS